MSANKPFTTQMVIAMDNFERTETEAMELDERKVKILDAVIRNYLATGEPVGSRTISKYTDLNLSSATIRNEMADLEELGYIVQPHTSAGRIPSDKGYRFYVDHLIQEKDKEVSDMKEFVIEKTQRMEQVLQQMAKMLATNTNYATMITSPSYHTNKVKFIQLSRVEEHRLLAVVVVEGNIIKNTMCCVSPTNSTFCERFFVLKNTHLGIMQRLYLSLIASSLIINFDFGTNTLVLPSLPSKRKI